MKIFEELAIDLDGRDESDVNVQLIQFINESISLLNNLPYRRLSSYAKTVSDLYEDIEMEPETTNAIHLVTNLIPRVETKLKVEADFKRHENYRAYLTNNNKAMVLSKLRTKAVDISKKKHGEAWAKDPYRVNCLGELSRITTDAFDYLPVMSLRANELATFLNMLETVILVAEKYLRYLAPEALTQEVKKMVVDQLKEFSEFRKVIVAGVRKHLHISLAGGPASKRRNVSYEPMERSWMSVNDNESIHETKESFIELTDSRPNTDLLYDFVERVNRIFKDLGAEGDILPLPKQKDQTLYEKPVANPFGDSTELLPDDSLENAWNGWAQKLLRFFLSRKLCRPKRYLGIT